MNSNTSVARVLGILAVSASLGCEDVSWPEREYVSSVRILGVRAEPPTLAPGATSELSVYCADGRVAPNGDPSCDLEIAWFAACDNPPKNDPTECYGTYAAWAKKLARNVTDTPVEDWPEGFGFGKTYRFQAPSTILSDTFEALGQTVHFGHSYVFFAACAGKLVATTGSSDRLPVECYDRITGKALDQRAFTVGYTTIRSFDLVTNRNPTPVFPRMNHLQYPTSCNTDAPCPSGFECTSDATCSPVVARCDKNRPETCRGYCFDFGLASNDFLVFAKGGAQAKSVWIETFTNAGMLSNDPDFGVSPPQPGEAGTQIRCLGWRPPAVATEHAHLWAVVRDDFGGLAVWDQRILVR
ncbi:MAG TPA: hypothetical protein VKP30_03225 [Polyangiaceae bacterium]|nr:hypothetical protein [Polyangiaceae bacterium]